MNKWTIDEKHPVVEALQTAGLGLETIKDHEVLNSSLGTMLWVVGAADAKAGE